MKRPTLLTIALLATVAIAASGCHKRDTAGSAPATATTSKGATMGTQSSTAVGLNPNYQGPANGGLGSKAGQ